MKERLARAVSIVVPAIVVAASPCQDLAKKLRAGGSGSVAVASAALDRPSEEDVNGLLELIEAGSSVAGRRGIAAELAFAVLGWWSMQDAGIADGLYDRIESGEWTEIDLELLRMAIIGCANGTERAQAWIARGDRGWRQGGWWLLRRVGANAVTMSQCVDQALASEDEFDQQLGMELMWEFEIASEDRTRRLESMYERASEDLTRWAVLWAMVRGGGFHTRWMLEARDGLTDYGDVRWFDRLFEFMVPSAVMRLVRELPQLEGAERLQVLRWLGSHLHDAELRRALFAIDEVGSELLILAPDLARHALGEPDVLPIWVRCLSDVPRLQQLGCLGLAHLGTAAAPHIAEIAGLLAVEPDGRQVSQIHVRASAIHALGALGPQAGEYLDAVAAFVDSEDEVVAASAAWAVPRLRGQTAPGPWQPEHRERTHAFAAETLVNLRGPDSALLKDIPHWPAATRRLALPRLLVALLDEQLGPPPRYMSFGMGSPPPMEQLLAVEPDSISDRMITVPERILWRWMCAHRVDALQSLGPTVRIALPLLEWLAPRRPHVARLVESLKR